MDSINLIKLKILRVVAEEEGIRTLQLQQRVFLSSSQIRRYTQQLERAGLLIVEPESNSATAAFVHRLGPNTTRAMAVTTYEALLEANNGLSELKCLVASIDSRFMQLEHRVNQLFENWQ